MDYEALTKRIKAIKFQFGHLTDAEVEVIVEEVKKEDAEIKD